MKVSGDWLLPWGQARRHHPIMGTVAPSGHSAPNQGHMVPAWASDLGACPTLLSWIPLFPDLGSWEPLLPAPKPLGEPSPSPGCCQCSGFTQRHHLGSSAAQCPLRPKHAHPQFSGMEQQIPIGPCKFQAASYTGLHRRHLRVHQFIQAIHIGPHIGRSLVLPHQPLRGAHVHRPHPQKEDKDISRKGLG